MQAFMLAVLIVYTPNQLHFPTSLGIMGVNVFNILMLLAFLTLALRPPEQRREPPPPVPPMTRVLLCYYGVLAFALAMAWLRGSAHPIEDAVAFKTLVSYSLLYFLAYYSVRTERQINVLIVLTMLVYLGAAGEAIMQGIEYGLNDFTHEERASGPFGIGAGNSNFAGVFYAIFATFCLSIALLGKGRVPFRWRVLALLAYVIGCLAIIATFSRQAMLIVAVTTMLLALRRNPLIALGVITVMLAYPLWAPEGVVQRIEMTQQRTLTGQEVLESSAASRYELWRAGVEITLRNPLGVGINQFQHEVEPLIPKWIEARDAQNMYLRFAAEAGIQGLLVFLAVLYAFFRLGTWLARVDHPPVARVYGLAACMAVVAIVLGNIFSSTFAFGEIMANAWVLFGLLARAAVMAAPQATSMEVEMDNIRRAYARWQEGPRQAPR